MPGKSKAQKIDQGLGRLLSRFWAVLAFLGSSVSIAFGLFLLVKGYFPGAILLLLGFFFLWAGLRAWRDRAGLGDLLNRDFGKTPGKQGPGRVQ